MDWFLNTKEKPLDIRKKIYKGGFESWWYTKHVYFILKLTNYFHLPHLFLTIILIGKYNKHYEYPHFADEKTESQSLSKLPKNIHVESIKVRNKNRTSGCKFCAFSSGTYCQFGVVTVQLTSP